MTREQTEKRDSSFAQARRGASRRFVRRVWRGVRKEEGWREVEKGGGAIAVGEEGKGRGMHIRGKNEKKGPTKSGSQKRTAPGSFDIIGREGGKGEGRKTREVSERELKKGERNVIRDCTVSFPERRSIAKGDQKRKKDFSSKESTKKGKSLLTQIVSSIRRSLPKKRRKQRSS